MKAFRDFEVQAIEKMADGVLSADLVDLIVNWSGETEFEYTGEGYFLSISDPKLPDDRVVLSEPAVVGSASTIQCGFVCFLEGGEFTLECHKWGSVDVPEDFRDLDVEIATPPVNTVDLR